MILSSAHHLSQFHMTTEKATLEAGVVIHTYHAQNVNYKYWQGVWFRKLQLTLCQNSPQNLHFQRFKLQGVGREQIRFYWNIAYNFSAIKPLFMAVT